MLRSNHATAPACFLSCAVALRSTPYAFFSRAFSSAGRRTKSAATFFIYRISDRHPIPVQSSITTASSPPSLQPGCGCRHASTRMHACYLVAKARADADMAKQLNLRVASSESLRVIGLVCRCYTAAGQCVLWQLKQPLAPCGWPPIRRAANSKTINPCADYSHRVCACAGVHVCART